MDHKKSPNRSKRQAKVLEDYWDCSVCTYRNTAEAFKCLMCDIRKGTSTRKPRINPQLVAQQAAPTFSGGAGGGSGGERAFKAFKKDGSEDKATRHKRRASERKGKKAWRTPRLKNVDRSTAQTREITVNDVTVLITEYKPKKKKTASEAGTGAENATGSTSEADGTASELSDEDGRGADIATDSRSS